MSAITPSLTPAVPNGKTIPNAGIFTQAGVSWQALSFGVAYSLLQQATNYRFEVINGQNYTPLPDPAWVMRSEVYGPGFPFNTRVTFAFGLLVRSTTLPTNNWEIFGQIHADNSVSGASPPFAFDLRPDGSGGMKLQFDLNYNAGSGVVFTNIGSVPFTYNTLYNLQVVFSDSNGAAGGFVQVTVNGVVAATYNGPTGYVAAVAQSYPKWGIYTGGNGSVFNQLPLPGQDIVAGYYNPTFVVGTAFGATWGSLIGAGGLVPGISVANDNTPFIRCDTGGAYYWNGSVWVPVITNTSMPPAFVSPYITPSAYELVSAPSNSSILAMVVNGHFLYSTNKGVTFTQSSLAQDTGAVNTNGSGSIYGPHIGIDPANPSVVFAGMPKNGLFSSVNNGATFGARISAVALSTSIGIAGGCMLVLFDRNSAVVGGKTQGIYAASYGSGWYRSLDGGATWSAIAGSPTNSVSARISNDGYLYAVSNSGALSIFNGTSWSTPSLGTITCIAPDPNVVGHVVAINTNGAQSISVNHGSTWTAFSSTGTQNLIATDIPWLATSTHNYIDANQAVYVGTKMLVTGGVGVWSNTPGATTPGTVTYTSQSIGIEQLVANYIISPPGTGPVVASWDRPLFLVKSPGVLPSAYVPNTAGNLSQGWSVNYAPQNTNVIIGLANNFGSATDNSGVSANGLSTFTNFGSTSPIGGSGAFAGGDIIAFDATHFFWAGAGGSAAPSYSTDGGASWSASSGLPGTAYNQNYYWNKHALAIDRVTPGVARIYYQPTGAIYETTNSGATWALVTTKAFTGTNILCLMKSVPNNANHLFFSGGTAGGGSVPANVPFYYSTNGGSTWTALANVAEVLAFGFGAPFAGKTYPTVYIAGWVSGVYGIWRNIDIFGSGTWQQLGPYPTGNYDIVSTLEGDINAPGWVYVGFHDTGYQFAYSSDAGPFVAPTAPLPGATVAGSSVALTAVHASGIAASSVTWELDGSPIASGLSATWDSTSVGHGAHTLSVVSVGNGQTSTFPIPITTA